MQYLAIKKASFDILLNQRGDLYHLRGDKQKWMDAYHEEIQKTIYQINFAPSHVLDIGSGLGAIDVCLARLYSSHCTLVDGEKEDLKVKRHAEPFCNRDAVEEFFGDNEVQRERWQYLAPEQISDSDPLYDLVISTRSWCFHYPPEAYLSYVQRHTVPASIILVDMRRHKKEWRERMRASFEEMGVCEEHEKFLRIVYKVRGKTQ